MKSFADVSPEQQRILAQLGSTIRTFGVSPYAGSLTQAAEQYQAGPEELLEEDYVGSMRYLPAALFDIARKQSQCVEVLRAVLAYLWVWRAEPGSRSITPLIAESLVRTLLDWTSHFERSDLIEAYGASPYLVSISLQGPLLDEILSCLYEVRVRRDVELFDVVFSGWAATALSPDHAAHLVAFAFRVRCRPSALPIYRCDRTLEFAFDDDRMEQFLEESAQVFTRLFGAQMSEGIRMFDCSIVT